MLYHCQSQKMPKVVTIILLLSVCYTMSLHWYLYGSFSLLTLYTMFVFSFTVFNNEQGYKMTMGMQWQTLTKCLIGDMGNFRSSLTDGATKEEIIPKHTLSITTPTICMCTYRVAWLNDINLELSSICECHNNSKWTNFAPVANVLCFQWLLTIGSDYFKL